MEVKTWVLVGSLRRSTCSFALAGMSVLSDCISALTSLATRSMMPVDLPFFPFGLFSSGIVFSSLWPHSGQTHGHARLRFHSVLITHTGKYDPGSLNLLGCPLGHW